MRESTGQICVYFSEKDNHAPDNSGKGWVDNLCYFLKKMLEEMLTPCPEIYLVDNSKILDLPKTAEAKALVVCLSGAFVEEPYSIQSFDAAMALRERGGGVFKIYKSPVPLQKQPSAVRNLIGHNLYHEDKYGGSYQVITDFFGPEAEKSFWPALIDLCYEIAGVFKKEPQNHKTGTYTKATVYLAETGSDLLKERAMVKRELQRRGYAVLPHEEYPTAPGMLEKHIRHDLARCALSIHMFGNEYGQVNDVLGMSMPELQSTLASAHAKDHRQLNGSAPGPFKRLIWIPPDTSRMEERLKFYLDRIVRSEEEIAGAELLQARIEDFKSLMLANLNGSGGTAESGAQAQSEAAANAQGQRKSGSPLIYLLADVRDEAAAKALSGWLRDQGCSILSLSGVTENPRLAHQAYLNKCDAAIIYFGEAKEEWATAKLHDLLKAPGMGRGEPITHKAVVTDVYEKAGIIERKVAENQQLANIKIVPLDRGGYEPLHEIIANIKN